MKKKILENTMKLVTALTVATTLVTSTVPVFAATTNVFTSSYIADVKENDEKYNDFVSCMRHNYMLPMSSYDVVWGNGYDVNLKKGETYTLKSYSPVLNDADFIYDNDLLSYGKESCRFKSSNTKVATVDEKGKITAKKNGSAYITVNYYLGKRKGKLCKSVKYKVSVSSNKIVPKSNVSYVDSLNSDVLKIDLSSTKKQVLALSDKKKVKKWKSSDSSIISVDKNGVLKGKTFGTVVISCVDSKGVAHAVRVTAACSCHDWELTDSYTASYTMCHEGSDGGFESDCHYAFSPNCSYASFFLSVSTGKEDTKVIPSGYTLANGQFSKPHHKIYTYTCKTCGLKYYDYDDERPTEAEAEKIFDEYSNKKGYETGSRGSDCNTDAVMLTSLAFGDMNVTVHTDFTKLHVGDIIAYPGHNEVVQKVTNNGKSFVTCGGGHENKMTNKIERYWNHSTVGFYTSLQRYPEGSSMHVYTHYPEEIDDEYIVARNYSIYDILPGAGDSSIFKKYTPTRYYDENGNVVEF